MESEQQVQNLNPQSKWNQVTPLSKYLAMALFILMPFIGGWVGYTYAPEKVVEVEKILYSEPSSNVEISKTSSPIATSSSNQAVTKESVIKPEGVEEYECVTKGNSYPHVCYRLTDYVARNGMVENLSDLAQSQGVIEYGRTELYNFVYQTADTRKVYFLTGIPDSDACCGFVEFDLQTQLFKKRNDLYLGPTNSVISSTKRYIASAMSSLSEFSLADLESGSVIYEEAITGGSLKSTDCGFFGYGTDLRFSDDEKQVYYGIYSDKKVSNDTCKFEKIETRTYSIPR